MKLSNFWKKTQAIPYRIPAHFTEEHEAELVKRFIKWYDSDCTIKLDSFSCGFFYFFHPYLVECVEAKSKEKLQHYEIMEGKNDLAFRGYDKLCARVLICATYNIESRNMIKIREDGWIKHYGYTIHSHPDLVFSWICADEWIALYKRVVQKIFNEIGKMEGGWKLYRIKYYQSSNYTPRSKHVCRMLDTNPEDAVRHFLHARWNRYVDKPKIRSMKVWPYVNPTGGCMHDDRGLW